MANDEIHDSNSYNLHPGTFNDNKKNHDLIYVMGRNIYFYYSLNTWFLPKVEFTILFLYFYIRILNIYFNKVIISF